MNYPSSSPPSSPNTNIDSSPPSSRSSSPRPGVVSSSVHPVALPDSFDVATDTRISKALVHPFAASAKANKSPPEYWKRYPSPQPQRLGSSSSSFSSSSLEEAIRPSWHTKRPRLSIDASTSAHATATRPTKPVVEDPAFTRPNHVSDRVATSYDFDSQYHCSRGQRMTRVMATRKEQAIWDQKIADAIDNSNGNLDLEKMQLTTIPDDIENLGKLWTIQERLPVVVTGGRQSNASSRTDLSSVLKRDPTLAAAATRTGAFTRQSSFRGQPAHLIQLYLRDNRITRLPKALFMVHNLQVLDLSYNKVKFIPPEIASLKNLKTLNVTGNRIKFLPSEILFMNLDRLSCNVGNRWLSPPSSSSSSSSSSSLCFRRTDSYLSTQSNNPTVSPIESLGRCPHPSPTPSLAELCLRKIVQDNLIETDEAKLLRMGCYLPPHLRRLFESLVPGFKPPFSDNSVIDEEGRSDYTKYREGLSEAGEKEDDQDDDDEPVLSLGTCPSTRHSTATHFILPQEIRYSWESQLRSGLTLGGRIPFQWRGCSKGCLEFLDDCEDEVEVLIPGYSEGPTNSDDEVGEVLDLGGRSGEGFDEFD